MGCCALDGGGALDRGSILSLTHNFASTVDQGGVRLKLFGWGVCYGHGKILYFSDQKKPIKLECMFGEHEEPKRSMNEEELREQAICHEEEIAHRKITMEGKTHNKGEITTELVEYYHLNMAHDDVIRRLKRLCERIHGPSPEKVNQEKPDEPDGVLSALRFNNRRHGEDLENILNLLSVLESSI